MEAAGNIFDEEKREAMLAVVAWPAEVAERRAGEDERKTAAALSRVGARVDFEAFARRRAVAQAKRDAAERDAGQSE